MKTVAGFILGAWSITIGVLAYCGVFIGRPGQPPVGVGLAFALPLIAFVAAFSGMRRVRQMAAQLPPTFLVSLHGWRFVGLGFIAAGVRGLLPPGFAWPAGLGDVAIALFAPYLVFKLGVDRPYRAGLFFVTWNVLGLLDFFLAVGLGVAHQISPGSFHATVDTRLMQELPFALIPCFFVPLLAMTHVVLLYQAYQARSTAKTSREEMNEAIA